MPDVDALFVEMIATLQEAHTTIEGRLQALSEEAGWQVSVLAKILRAARTFAGQADSLLSMMLDRNAADSSLAVVEDLLNYFEDLRDRLEAELGFDQE